MSNLCKRPPYQKGQKPAPKPRKRLPRVSKKRSAYRASTEGQKAREWMKLVSDLPCVICGKPGPSDVHHVCHDRFSTARVSDFAVIPLCRCHHTEGPEAIHNGKESWRDKHGPDWSYLSDVSAQLDGPQEIDF